MNGFPYYQPAKNQKGEWRIICNQNGFNRDVCGAINNAVVLEQCKILNDNVDRSKYYYGNPRRGY